MNNIYQLQKNNRCRIRYILC